jgi:hypothetical protein
MYLAFLRAAFKILYDVFVTLSPELALPRADRPITGSYATMWQVTVDQRPVAHRHAVRMPLAPSDALRGANDACATCSVVKKAVPILRQLRQALVLGG